MAVIEAEGFLSNGTVKGVERVVVTVATVVIAALLVWVGYSTHETAVSVAVLVARLNDQGAQVERNAEQIEKFRDRLRSVEKGRP